MKRVAIAAGGLVAAVAVAAGGIVGFNALTAETTTTINPGASFDAAYKAAACDSVVLVKGGTYGPQKITRDPSKANCRVTFRAVAGETPFVNGDLLLGDTSGTDGPDHITIDGIDGNDGIGTRCFVNDVIIENVKWPVPVISGSENVTIRNSEFGPAVNRVFNITSGGCSSPYRNITIEGNYFHDSLVTDYVNPPPNGYHSECIQQDLGNGLQNLVIRGNVLQNCQDFGILFNGGVNGLVVENNMIDDPFLRIQGQESAFKGAATPRGGNSLRFACNPACSSNISVRNNTVLGGIVVDGGNTNVTLTGNISRTPVGTFGLAASPGLFVDGSPADGSMNLHLRSGSAAIDRGNPANFTALDFDGESRSGTPDAGADELGGGPPPPPPTTTEPPPTTTEPPPTTTEPPPTTTTPPTDSLPLRVISQTASTVTLGWTPVKGAGYRFWSDNKIVSYTWDENRASVKFSRKAGAKLEVQALQRGVIGALISP